jgi:hypothetical protein
MISEQLKHEVSIYKRCVIAIIPLFRYSLILREAQASSMYRKLLTA